MIQEVIKQWDENKYKLEHYFCTTKQEEYTDSYKTILQKIIELVITNKCNHYQYDATKITVVDDGDYQGTQIFLIPTNRYKPNIEDYLITHTYYGSCSGCDTLMSIKGFSSGYPNGEQVKKYMILALHLVQKMQRISDND
ncbi:MAG: hypothetical protein EKK63_15925 [Acinetobacter sp.]|uniref:hypothetical protein n=1 Tax=Acinetobacter sp. TaxID=472 RepID=UPI000FBE949D|nr:hypothetical protein [Acinetobacter sp.]RUP37056.1 MAG: hypothetical protein EKK63_15925 [Acinetobacter sp.]